MTLDLNPTVSVIIPFYNRESLTLLSIKSVLEQTYKDFEIILVNDGSNEPISLITDINNPKITLYHQSNKGPAAARNLGLQHARGKYIAFLDSDDIFMPEKLKLQVELFDRNPNIWLTHTSYKRINETGKDLGIINSGTFTGKVFPGILNFCPIATPTVMISRKVIDNSIFYDENFKIAEDIIFYSKITKESEIIGLDIPLSSILITDDSHASNSIAQVEGLKNIFIFLENRELELTTKQYREVKSKLNFSLSFYNYTERINKNIINFLASSTLVFVYSRNKFKTLIYIIKMIHLAIVTKKLVKKEQ